MAATRKRSKKRAPSKDKDLHDDTLLEVRTDALRRSPITQHLSEKVRRRLNAALLGPARTDKVLEQVAREFDLTKHHISKAHLKEYAEELNKLLRPVAASQFMAEVLRCLPPSSQREMLKGNQVLLLSKATHVLADPTNSKIEVGELVKLASVLRAAAQSGKGSRRGRSAKQDENKETAAFDFAHLRRGVQRMAGVEWPFPESTTHSSSAKAKTSMAG